MKATVIYFANPTKVEQDKVVIARENWAPLPTIIFDTTNHLATIQVDNMVRHMIRDIIRVEEVDNYVERVSVVDHGPLPEISPAPAVDDGVPF